MGKPSTTQTITELIEPVLKEDNLDLVEVEFKKGGKQWFLRIFIYKESGITVEDCHRVSRQIEDLIDVNEVIDSPYTLEVSSPGLDRPLKREKDFLRNTGKKIQVNAFSPIKDRKQFSGTIKDFKENTLYLVETKEEVLEIPLSNIASAKLIIEF